MTMIIYVLTTMVGLSTQVAGTKHFGSSAPRKHSYEVLSGAPRRVYSSTRIWVQGLLKLAVY